MPFCDAKLLGVIRLQGSQLTPAGGPLSPCLPMQDTELAQVPFAEQQLKAAVDKVTRELQMLRGLQPAAMR